MTLDLRGLWSAFISCLVGYSWSTEQNAELCDRYQHHYCSYLRTLYRQQKVFGYRSVKSSSLRCSNCREVNKKRERRHATYRQTRRLGVIGWTSADTLVWNVFGFWLFVYLPLPVVLLASAAASLLPLGRVLRLGVLNPLGIKCCSKEQGCCCSVWLFESRVNIFLYSWQKWLAARWGGWIKHLWVTLSNFTAEAKPNLCMK